MFWVAPFKSKSFCISQAVSYLYYGNSQFNVSFWPILTQKVHFKEKNLQFFIFMLINFLGQALQSTKTPIFSWNHKKTTFNRRILLHNYRDLQYCHRQKKTVQISPLDLCKMTLFVSVHDVMWYGNRELLEACAEYQANWYSQ